jgi:hypothetical protein
MAGHEGTESFLGRGLAPRAAAMAAVEPR